MELSDFKHDQTNWRFHRETAPDGHSQRWWLESDEYKCMAMMELPHLSNWFKDRNPEWEKEYNADCERIQANADLIQSAPRMLEALIAAQSGDLSLIDDAIAHATGEKEWHE